MDPRAQRIAPHRERGPERARAARRLAMEQGIDLDRLLGSGPGGAVVAADVLERGRPNQPALDTLHSSGGARLQSCDVKAPSTVWRIMADRMRASWTGVPHFFVLREVEAAGIVEARAQLARSPDRMQATYTHLINPPQAAILAVGRIADRVVPVDGRPAVRPITTVTLACDHRVIDGARAAAFLEDLVRAVREPERWVQ